MARNKCPYCEEFFDREKEESVHLKNRYYHKACYDTMQEKKAEEERGKIELENYIKSLFNSTYINARIRQQIKRMREQFNYSYSGILKSLIYFFEVRRNPIEKANGGIGIVPYVYEDAKKYYYDLYIAQKRNENKNFGEFVTKGRRIVIKPPVRKQKERKLFNLEED